MEWFSVPELPSIFESHTSHLTQDRLPLIYPSFTLPPLGDKPNDPIISHLLNKPRLTEKSVEVTPRVPANNRANGQDEVDSWSEDAERHAGPVTWNDLYCPDGTNEAARSELLSELSPRTVETVVKHSVPLSDEKSIHLSLETLQELLQRISVGESTQLFRWDKDKERLRLIPGVSGVTIDGLSASATNSLVVRFLLVGTLLRRLETFTFARIPGIASAEYLAFCHAVRVVLGYVEQNIASRPASRELIASGLVLMEEEKVLLMLSEMCGRHPLADPPFPALPSAPSPFIAAIYRLLDKRINSFSLGGVRAIAGYVLTKCLSPWHHALCIRAGLAKPPPSVPLSLPKTIELPNFISPPFAQDILRGIQSLDLLRVAEPNHPACRPRTIMRLHDWKWTSEGVELVLERSERHLADLKTRIMAWRRRTQRSNNDASATLHNPLPNAQPDSLGTEQKGGRHYAPELQSMSCFDQQPGTSIQSVVSGSLNHDVTHLKADIETFPDSLPVTCPTLQLLTQALIVEPLASHCRLISASLLDLFVADLGLISHFDVLARFMLFRDTGFVTRLRTALFDEHAPSAGTMASWGVGLNPTLSPTGEWPPPGGYGVSYLLRNVVSETLADIMETNHNLEARYKSVIKAADWRMGFIIREPGLTPGPVRKKNKDLDALNFLHLQYSPPVALDTILSADLMQKFERVTDFLLSLLHVDSVCRSIFRSMMEGAVFSDKAALHTFRLFSRQIHVFIGAVVGYVFDSAIGRRWDTFVRRMKKLQTQSSEHNASSDSGLAHTVEDPIFDVFTLSEYASSTLDDILSACLLKSRQRAAGTTLRVPMELIMSLGHLLREIASGRLTEAAGIAGMRDLHRNWQTASRNLAKVLRDLDSRGRVNPAKGSDAGHDIYAEGSTSPEGEGLRDLLLRLDMTEWYAKKTS